MNKTRKSSWIIVLLMIGLMGCGRERFDTPLEALGWNIDRYDEILIYKEVATPNGIIMMDGHRENCASVTFLSEKDGQWRFESSGGEVCHPDETKTNLALLAGGNIMRLRAIYGFVPTNVAYMQVVWEDGLTMQHALGRDGIVLLPRYDRIMPESYILYDASHTIIEQGDF